MSKFLQLVNLRRYFFNWPLVFNKNQLSVLVRPKVCLESEKAAPLFRQFTFAILQT